MSQPTSMNSTWLATPSTPAFSNRVMLRMQSGTYRPNNSHLTKPARNLLKLHASDTEGLFRQSNTKKACSVISKGTVMASASGSATTTTWPCSGGLRDVPANDEEVESLARFAVDEHNKKQNALLEFARVVKAKEQVVAGVLYHLTLEVVVEAGKKKKLYEAKVCVQPWLNFRELREFKPASDGSGWREVPGDDPEVQQVADHAVKTIQQRSNSLFPYELQEVVHAKAEVTGEAAKFHMLLRLKRGDKEEKFKVEVHKKREGALHLNHMEQVLHD